MKDSRNAGYWIEKLRLEPHPEGGYFRQTYKSELAVAPEGNSNFVAKRGARPGQPGVRAASTAIYFLLERENFSALHRLRSDEIWHFYAGSPLVVHVIEPAGEYSRVLLGNDPESGQVFQAVVRTGCWFGAELVRDSHFSQHQREVGHAWSQDLANLFALVGCTVAPGFEFEDFELAKRAELTKQYPQHRELIQRLTRE